MELYLDDCFNILEDTPDKSIDFIYCDLPYNETACKFDKEIIDLDKLWFHYKRIAKNDETPFMFSCSVKFGNKLINSNPKWFRFEFLWIKSSPTGFLNSRRLPMRKSEMVYVFYKKLPSVYGENLNLHHTHKFLKETPTKRAGKDGVDNSKMIKNRSSSGKEISYKYDPPLPNNVVVENNLKMRNNRSGNCFHTENEKNVPEGKFDPPCPTNIIVEGENGNAWNTEKRNKPIVRVKGDQYEPPLPTNVLEIKSEKKLHPTQKPVALIEFLLKYYSRENDLCLDVCMGSGTTGIACLNMNRRFMGIEKDENFFAIAMERLEKHPNYKSSTTSS